MTGTRAVASAFILATSLASVAFAQQPPKPAAPAQQPAKPAAPAAAPAKPAAAQPAKPATTAAAQQTKGYETGGQFNVFLKEAQKFAVVRPVTPAYPYISTVFSKTAMDILAGADVKGALDQAVSQIDTNLSTSNYSAGS